ncbi:MAG TPA: GNAT family N-acetyltransferase [Chloroflexota bacterium]|nr:GNAT family N-acetyltransferase [Chloroflexota bacterium]
MFSDLHIRPAVLDDLAAVTHLIAAQLTADFQGMAFTAADLEERWQRFNLETDTWLALVEGTAVAYLDLDRTHSVPMLFLSDTAYADAGIQLLQRAEQSVADGTTLIAQISDKNQTLQQLYAQAGYRHGLTFSNMEIVLTSPPPPPHWPEGIEVRPYNLDQDAHKTYLADEEASQDKGYHTPLLFADWRDRMGLDRDDFDPSWWYLAWVGDEIAAVCLCFYRLSTGWIDHLGVRRPYRRQGLGKSLLLHAFVHFYQRGVAKVMLNVDSGSLTNAPHLYESVGMKTVQAYHIYRKEL